MFDIIVVIVLGLGFYLGYQRGIIKTLFDTLSLIVAILAALKLSPVVITIMQKIMSESPKMAYFLGLLLTFVLVLFLVRFVGRKVESILEAAHINFINKIGGGGLQAFFFAYLLSLLIWLVNSVGLMMETTKQTAVTYPFMAAMPEVGKAAIASVKPLFKSFWDKTSEIMDDVADTPELQPEAKPK